MDSVNEDSFSVDEIEVNEQLEKDISNIHFYLNQAERSNKLNHDILWNKFTQLLSNSDKPQLIERLVVLTKRALLRQVSCAQLFIESMENIINLELLNDDTFNALNDSVKLSPTLNAKLKLFLKYYNDKEIPIDQNIIDLIFKHNARKEHVIKDTQDAISKLPSDMQSKENTSTLMDFYSILANYPQEMGAIDEISYLNQQTFNAAIFDALGQLISKLLVKEPLSSVKKDSLERHEIVRKFYAESASHPQNFIRDLNRMFEVDEQAFLCAQWDLADESRNYSKNLLFTLSSTMCALGIMLFTTSALTMLVTGALISSMLFTGIAGIVSILAGAGLFNYSSNAFTSTRNLHEFDTELKPLF